MGTLFYGAERTAVQIPDVMLRHLEVVITAKLRRDEGLLLSWHDDDRIGDGRSAAWINAASELLYNYDDGKDVSIDEALLEELTIAATTDGGIFLRDGTLAVNTH